MKIIGIRCSYNMPSTLGALISSAYHAQYIAIIIGPEKGPRRPGKRFRALSDFIAGQRSGDARQQDPFGLRDETGGKERIDSDSLKAEFASNPPNPGLHFHR